MTWKAYIDPIKKSKLINKSKPDIIMELFKVAAGCEMEFGESAAKRWYYGEKNCNSYKWFPKGKFDNDNLKNLYDLFRKRHDSKLEELQQKFRETADSNSLIDLETKDMDIFCCSLVNQFLDLLGFQIIDITEILPNKKNVSDNQASGEETANDSQASDDETTSEGQESSSGTTNSNQISSNEISSDDQTSDDETVSDNEASDGKTPSVNQTSDDECVDTETAFITSENNEESNIKQTDSQNTFSGAQLSVPNDCKICLYCKNWEGNTKNAYKSIAGVYGTCIVYDKKILSTTDGTNCHMFIPNYEQIHRYEINQRYKTTKNLMHSFKKN